jgi:auxin-responsive protein IAA
MPFLVISRAARDTPRTQLLYRARSDQLMIGLVLVNERRRVRAVGWPPVRAYRKNAFHAAAEAARRTNNKGEELQGGGGRLYVKVSMDGAPYLRKVDLRTYGGYRELRDALDALFGCFSSSSASSSSADGGCQFAVAYEDKDGDLMLAGDVPWE